MKTGILIVIISLLASCTDPIVMIPGGKLKGQVTPAPSTWSKVSDVVQLEVQPSDPYSLNIWAVVSHGNLHVATRAAKWVPMLEASTAVRVKIDGKVYELQADRLTESSDLEDIAKAYLDKYELDEPMQPETSVYRLNARS